MCITIFLCVRLFYRRKYIVYKDRLVCDWRGKIVFDIKKKDIIAVGYRKATWKNIIFIPIYHLFTDPMTDVLSIRYKQADIEGKRIFNGIKNFDTLTPVEKQEGLKEYVESFSRRDIKRICTFLNLNTTPVEVQHNLD